jgi:hypothetical protein
MKSDDDLAILAAKVWFKYLGLIGMMAGMLWMKWKTGHPFLTVAIWISMGMALFYFDAVFCRPDGWLQRRMPNRWWGRLIGLLVGAVLCGIAFNFSFNLVRALATAR